MQHLPDVKYLAIPNELGENTNKLKQTKNLENYLILYTLSPTPYTLHPDNTI